MDKERLNLELEIDNILSEFSKKKAASQQPARKVSDNTINMLLEDILKESGKSDGSVLQKKTAVSFDGTQKAQKPVAVQEQKTRQEKTEKGANAADGKTIAVKLSDIESVQKLGFIPEAQNDMIFSVICEELGLFGAICLILLYLLIIWRFMVIANNAADLYGALLVVGIMAHISIQVVLNIAVVTNTIPNTGISLPFVSYGGTSILFLLSEMGLALSVSRGIKFEVT